MTRQKGMRDIPTSQSLVVRASQVARSQLVTRFARLEHEKERLERGLGVLRQQQQANEHRLRKVDQELAQLEKELFPAPASGTPARRGGGRAQDATRRRSRRSGEGARSQEVVFEY